MGAESGGVGVDVTATGEDRYRMTAAVRLDCAPFELWELLCDWERFVAVGLPGMTDGFEWLSGGPRQAPSRFRFSVEDAVLEEEVYELTTDPESDRHRLRYRALGPALGVLEYDAIIDLEPTAAGRTSLSTERVVRLEQGEPPDMLAGMIEGEMQALERHFSARA